VSRIHIGATLTIGLLAVAVASASGADRSVAQLHVQAKIALGDQGAGITFADGAVWLQTVAKNELVRIDPATNRVTDRLKLPGLNGRAHDVNPPPAFGDHSFWLPNGAADGVIRVKIHPLRVAKTIPLDAPFFAAFGYGSVWVVQFDPYKWSRIDPVTNRLSKTFPATGPTAVATGAGSVWIVAHRARKLLRIDPKTNDIVATIAIKTRGGVPENEVLAFGSVWINDPQGPSIARIDMKKNKQRLEIVLPSSVQFPGTLTSGGGSVWVGSDHDLLRINPRTNRVDGMLAVKIAKNNPECGTTTDFNCFAGVTYGAGSVWAVDNRHHQVIRVAPH